MTDNSNREKEIFEHALDLASADEQQRYVESACGRDTVLLARIQALLRADEAGEEFLPEQPKDTVRIITEKPGDMIGRYKLLQQIGEGGCGVVYMAEQAEPVRRRVALKIIKLGMDTKSVITRFEAERQALALMDHPNIAKVFDAGATDTGRPYFVMELVRGIKITDYCDENNLSTEERLKLFTQVCHAIQHAHQKGVIHRDIKPSNILITVNDAVSVPKIIDFGIAKATNQQLLTDKTLFTAFEQFIGTPAYMSPEQAVMTSLDIDTRSDVYSLGVLLYELLTGKTPFDANELLKAGLDEIRRTIREVEPVKPSTRITQDLVAADVSSLKSYASSEGKVRADARRLLQEVRGDLDWIVMKCLEKDRTRRYETANGLATDINRHLDNEPVVARPPSRFYRFQKSVQRNKLAFGAATAVALALVIGLAVSTAMFFKEKQARRDALASAQAERKAKEAEAVQRKQAQEISDFLMSAFRSPDPARDGRTITVAEILDRDAQELQNKFGDDPHMKATLLETIAGSYSGLGLYTEAIRLLETAVDLRVRAIGPEDSATLQTKESLAILYWAAAHRWRDALPLAEEVLKVRRAKLGPEHAATLEATLVVAACYQSAGRMDEALSMSEVAVKILRAKLGTGHIGTFWPETGLADMYRSLGRTQEAFALDEPLLKHRKEKLGPDHPETLHSMRAVAADYIAFGRLQDAETLLENTVKLSRTRLGSEHPQTLLATRMLAVVLRDQGKLAEAEKLFHEALAISRKALGNEHAETIALLNGLNDVLQREGKQAEAK